MKKTLITIELFLALLVVILLVFLFFVFTNSKIKKKPTVSAVTVNTKELYCGISVTKPLIGSSISLPIEISGYVNGCGWDPYLNYVAKMKIYNSQNKLIGRPYLINKGVGNNSPLSTQFNLKIENLPIKEGDVTFVFESFGPMEKTMTVSLKIVPQTVDEN